MSKAALVMAINGPATKGVSNRPWLSLPDEVVQRTVEACGLVYKKGNPYYGEFLMKGGEVGLRFFNGEKKKARQYKLCTDDKGACEMWPGTRLFADAEDKSFDAYIKRKGRAVLMNSVEAAPVPYEINKTRGLVFRPQHFIPFPDKLKTTERSAPVIQSNGSEHQISDAIMERVGKLRASQEAKLKLLEELSK